MSRVRQLGDLFRNRQEPGRAGLPVMSVTMNDSLVLRDDLERRTESALRPDQHLLVKKGDIAYNMMRMWQGACGLATADGIVSPAYVVLAPKVGIDSRFAYHWFKSAPMIHLFWAYSHGLTEDRLRLYFDEFSEIPVAPPPLEQQRRISAVLDAWDQAIDQTERLIAAKRRRYRGLLTRYAAQFHNARMEFGELIDLVSVRVQPGADNVPSTSIELENIEAETGRLLGKENVTSGSALRSRFRAGDTLFGKLRPYLRKFGRPGFDGICSTEIWVLRAKPKKLDPALLFFLVQTPEFNAAASKQSGSKMPRADWDLVSATPIPCPHDPKSQSKAVALLSAAFNAAQPEMLKLDILRSQKRGLMQKLLTSEWRLDERFDPPAFAPQPAFVGSEA
jgi:type I restriction enzyme S subunit